MNKIIGTKKMSFTGKDGTQVEGQTFYTTEPIDPKQGKGDSADKLFLSKAKLEALDFTPEVGNEVEIFYNKFGKVSSLRLADDFID